MAQKAVLTKKGRGFEVAVTGNVGTAVIRVSHNGALTDLSNEPINRADFLIVTTVLDSQGYSEMADRVREWWNG